jgi:4a-hydroxytetrahydrobiopterin dehydratase
MALLTDEEITARLAGRPSWRQEGATIVRDREFADFAAALAHVNAVGAVAEERGHHPDVLLHGWNRVRLTVSTHSEGGLTEADFALADALDAL